MRTSKGFQQRQAFREQLSKLSDTRLVEIEPQDGESLRKLKVNVRRAANEMNVNVEYGESENGTLIVWSEPARERRRRGPRRRMDSGDGGS
jgi:hypothetical protein